MRVGGNSTPHERLRRLLDERWDGPDKAFAAEVPVSHTQLSRMLNGRANLRASTKLDRIAEVLGVSTDEILVGPSADTSVRASSDLARAHDALDSAHLRFRAIGLIAEGLVPDEQLRDLGGEGEVISDRQHAEHPAALLFILTGILEDPHERFTALPETQRTDGVVSWMEQVYVSPSRHSSDQIEVFRAIVQAFEAAGVISEGRSGLTWKSDPAPAESDAQDRAG